MLQAASGGGETVGGEFPSTVRLLRLRPEHRPGGSGTGAGIARERHGMAQERRRRRPEPPEEEIPFEDRGTEIVYSQVPSELGDEGRAKSRPPGAPENPTPREEHEISKKGEERIARQQVEDDE